MNKEELRNLRLQRIYAGQIVLLNNQAAKVCVDPRSNKAIIKTFDGQRTIIRSWSSVQQTIDEGGRFHYAAPARLIRNKIT